MRWWTHTRNFLEVAKAKAARTTNSRNKDSNDQPTAAAASVPDDGPPMVLLTKVKLPPIGMEGAGGDEGTITVEFDP